MKRRPVIAMDGPGGAGKSTVARLVAERCGYTYIDTGAMYRAVALRVLRHHPAVTDDALAALAGASARQCRIEFGPMEGVWLDGEDVTSALRGTEVERLVPRVAAVPAVRDALVEAQRRLGASGGVVMDGRDVGTCVFPDAEYKFFVTASQEERVERRYRDLARRGAPLTREAVARELAERDRQDRDRDLAPLIPAVDAIFLDTTGLTVDEVVARVLSVVGASAQGGVPSPAPVG